MELVKLEMTPKERKIAYARGEELLRYMGFPFVIIIFQQLPWWK